MEFKCKNCKFWNEGDCRKHAPKIIAYARATKTAFPGTYPDTWCGDFVPAAHEITTEPFDDNILKTLIRARVTESLLKFRHRKDAASDLGISERTLYRYIDKYELKHCFGTEAK